MKKLVILFAFIIIFNIIQTTAIEYCSPQVNSEGRYYISQVKLGDVVNPTTKLTTTCSDSTSISITLKKGEEIPLHIWRSVGLPTATSVFVDWDNDGNFDTGEGVSALIKVASERNGGTAVSGFKVPDYTTPGEHRMRILMSAFDNDCCYSSDGCSNFQLYNCNGGGLLCTNYMKADIIGLSDCEDYTIKVLGDCHDADGDYYIVEDIAPLFCENICGPNHNEACIGKKDCDDNLHEQNLVCGSFACTADNVIMRLSAERDALGSLWNKLSLIFNPDIQDSSDLSIYPNDGKVFIRNPAENSIDIFNIDRSIYDSISSAEIDINKVNDISFSLNERLYIANEQTDTIFELLVDITGLPISYTLRRNIGQGYLTDPVSVKDYLGRLYIADKANKIIVLNNTFGYKKTISLIGLDNPKGMVINDDFIYIGSKNNNKIIKINIDDESSGEFVIEKKWDVINDIGLAKNGNLLVFDSNSMYEYTFDREFVKKSGNIYKEFPVCYDRIFGSSYSGTSHPETCSSPVLWLSTETNSYASSLRSSEYNIPVCFDELTCRKIDSGNCANDEKCVVSLSADTNAELAFCEGGYSKKICCKQEEQEQLGDAHWQNIIGERISNAFLGDKVNLTVSGENIGQKEISYKIYKNGGFFADLLDTITFGIIPADDVTGEFSSIGLYEWTTEETGEFYFEASLDDINWISSEDNENGILTITAKYPKCEKGNNFARWFISETEFKNLIDPTNKDLCKGSAADGTDCCPNNYECRDNNGYICVSTREEVNPCDNVKTCADYNVQNFGDNAETACNDDAKESGCEVGKLRCDNIDFSDYSVNDECSDIIKTEKKLGCGCEWENNKCVKKQDTNIQIKEESITYSCVYDTSYTGDCSSDNFKAIEDFEGLSFKAEDESIWNALFSEEDYRRECENILCRTDDRTYPLSCPEPVLKLPFFSWIGFIVTGILLILFYLKRVIKKNDLLSYLFLNKKLLSKSFIYLL